MSDKFTEVRTDSGAGIGDWGHVPYADAIETLRKYLKRQEAEAQQGLADIEGGRVKVFHQRGPYAATNRREIPAPNPQGERP